jgi:hypothetical protein
MTFRLWVQNIWFEHKDELESIGQACDYDLAQYFNRYKYWLKREYRHQIRNTNGLGI